MSAALPVYGALFDELPVGLMDKGRWLQSLAGVFLSQVPRGQLAQLAVDQGQELCGRVRVAPRGGIEYLRNVGHNYLV